MECLIVSLDLNCVFINYLKNLKGIDKITIVSPHLPKKTDPSYNIYKGIDCYTDDYFYSREEFNQLNIQRRKSWYYQQFLKLKILEKLPYSEIILIDGDSVFGESLLLKYNNFQLTYIHRKLPSTYINFIEKLNIHPSPYNFITNEMKFDKKVFLEFLIHIQKSTELKWELGLAKLINSDSWLSEYQAYGSYYQSKFPDSRTTAIKSFRRFDLIKDDFLKALKHYDLIATENHHKTNMLKKLIITILYKFKIPLG